MLGWHDGPRVAEVAARFTNEDAIDDAVIAYTSTRTRAEVVDALAPLGLAVTAVRTPPERIDDDPVSAAWGLWPTVHHSKHGDLRVDGLPVHLSRTDWHVERGGPLLGEDNERVLTNLLGVDPAELPELREQGVI